MLPRTHEKSYEKFKQALIAMQELQQVQGDRQVKEQVMGLNQLLQKAQTIFQTNVLSLNYEELTPDLHYQVQSCQTEMHKQLRLLAMDVLFLQSARQVATVQQRQQQIGDRLLTLINYCDVLLS